MLACGRDISPSASDRIGRVAALPTACPLCSKGKEVSGKVLPDQKEQSLLFSIRKRFSYLSTSRPYCSRAPKSIARRGNGVPREPNPLRTAEQLPGGLEQKAPEALRLHTRHRGCTRSRWLRRGIYSAYWQASHGQGKDHPRLLRSGPTRLLTRADKVIFLFQALYPFTELRAIFSCNILALSQSMHRP